MLRSFLTAMLLLPLFSMPATAGDHAPGPRYASSIGEAHGLETWQDKAALEARITVDFGGQRVVSGTLLTETSMGRVRLTLDDGSVVVYNHGDAWTSPADSAFEGARFHILTWPYFLAAPMKLVDPGTHVETLGSLPLAEGEPLAAARLTFENGVGDSPDDWYILYRDAHDRLAGMAYIVTFGKSTEEAEKEPHAITYHDFVTVDGVTLSKRWQFWNWTREKGIHGDPIGEVHLSDPRFVTLDPAAFTRPEGARPEPAPGP